MENKKQKPLDIEIAKQISRLIDSYYLTGGDPFHKSNPIIKSLFKYLIKVEEFIWSYLTLNKSSDFNNLEIICRIQWRGEGIIESWNNFCFLFSKEYLLVDRYYFKNLWFDFLFMDFSGLDQNTFNIDSQFSSSNIKGEIQLYRQLWRLDLININQQILLLILVNKPQEDVKNILINPFEFKPGLRKISNINKDLEKLFTNEVEDQSTLKKWKNFWRKSSGGEMLRFQQFELKDQDTKLKGIPIKNKFSLKEIIGMKENIDELLLNINYFIKDDIINNIFIWGEPGTGKTSSVLGLLNKYQQIKLINISIDQINRLGKLINDLNKLPEKFILFGDDWSINFLDPKTRELKLLIDNQLINSKNVIFIITSNRAKLINFDRLEMGNKDELYNQNQINDAQALEDRFGVKLYYEAPRFEKLTQFIDQYSKQNKIIIKNRKALLKDFYKYCMQNQLDLPSGRAVVNYFNKNKNKY